MSKRVRGVLDTYGLPHRLPLPYRLLVVLIAFVAIGFLLWWFAPHGPVLVAILVVYVLIAVGGGLWWVFTSRELGESPGRSPKRPPSTTPPSTS